MSHTVLARKWRPKKFTDLVGQNNTVKILSNIIKGNRLHHAYLLTGTRGVGKTTIARIIAKALNCLELKNNEPCCNCVNCTQIDNGRFVDVIEIDAASNTGVDNIREVIENAQYTPTSGKYKVFIIDEVHMLSKSAFNAMLKTLEEPPPHIVFILATKKKKKVPITVISRCLQLKLRNLSANEIAQYLGHILHYEAYTAELNAIELISQAANGSMRDALSLTDQAIAFSSDKHITASSVEQMLGLTDEQSIYEILNAIIKQDSNILISICQKLNQDGANFENVLQQLHNKMFQISLIQLSNIESNHRLKQLAQQISLQDVQLYFDIINLGLEQISKISQKYSVFTMTLLRIISFTIGSNEEKNIVISANNCNITKTISTNIATERIEQPTATKQIYDSVHHQIDNSLDDSLELPIIVGDDNEIPIMTNTIATPLFVSWLDFIAQINLSEIPQNIAAVINNFEQIGATSDGTINLNIHQEFQPLITADVVDDIEQMLLSLYKSDFDLNINFITEKIQNSGSQKNKNKIAEFQRQAEESIANDAIIQVLQSKFSAKIIPSSIKPL
mgnify:FL=1